MLEKGIFSLGFDAAALEPSRAASMMVLGGAWYVSSHSGGIYHAGKEICQFRFSQYQAMMRRGIQGLVLRVRYCYLLLCPYRMCECSYKSGGTAGTTEPRPRSVFDQAYKTTESIQIRAV